MFRKTEGDHEVDLASPPKLRESRPIRPKNVSVIGPTLTFKGELSADEDLVIEGCIEGTIAHHKKHLTIGKQGRVKADIHASSVIIEGELFGDIHSEGVVSLANGAKVEGDIYCARIVMEDGARFVGRIDMGEEVAAKEAKEAKKAGPGETVDKIKVESASVHKVHAQAEA